METVVDKSGERVQRMFGGIARRYDLLNHTLSGGVDAWWRRQTVRLVPPEGDAPILDVCTGTGDLAFAYARAGGNRVPVIGTDFTVEMLELANSKRDRAVQGGRLKGGLVEFQEADTLRLPFADDRFQIVSVAFGLRNVADTGAGLREMTRVCRPGGRVAVLEFSKPRNRAFNALYQRYFRTVLPRIGQWVSGSREAAYDYLPQSVAEFPCGETLASLMEENGLEQVRRRPMTFGIATLYWGRKPGTSHAAALMG
ncbi:MAG: bifunctional demethylmenaquinone methyltransferase/2-methoxy-6-polyprenyl-1,4-benzoquinol methylase UbiE [Planctomyces sp.]|nr:bifunctional demethylmenaquinone methyltransferase/2-methoxy-6-polyprenyl-1,4-benzoquinol methylase UbiE [Planctomyces sp.]